MAIALNALGNNLTGSPAENSSHESVSSQTSGSQATYQINCSGSNRMGIVMITGRRTNAVAITAATTWGGVSMSSFPIIYGNNGTSSAGTNSSYAQFFYLADPPTGSQDIVSTWTSPSSAGTSTFTSVASAWTGVASVGDHTYDTGSESGTSLSFDVTSATGRVVLQHFEHEPLSANLISSYNQTHITHTRTGSYSQGLFGYAAGASTVSFTATRVSSTDYSEQAIQLYPYVSGNTTNFFSMF